ncbi:MAG TPA: helix-turn-helix transcriptional regulator [Candidatus Saccharimonadales bacterium]|nr:helix-turn-helix transcriptional regulator [Candidatus Saccharimonadales bacterium]
MNAKNGTPKMNADVRMYLAGIPEVTPDDLESLKAASKKLGENPAFLADYLKSRFVEEMLAAMEENGVSQTELAKRWGKSRQYLSKLLSENRRVNFTIETMCEFAGLLNRRLDIKVLGLPKAPVRSYRNKLKTNGHSKWNVAPRQSVGNKG